MTNLPNDNQFPPQKKTDQSTSCLKPVAQKRKVLWIVLIVIVAVLVATGIGFLIVRAVGKHSLQKNDKRISVPDNLVDSSQEDGSEISYQGKTYYLNPNIVSVLFMGVDKKSILTNENYGSNGQADSLFVSCFDTEKKVIKIIPISRETMVDVNQYTLEGNYAGVKKEQLCLAYAYGSTGQKSSENVLTSVKRLLYGMSLNSYVAIDFQGMKALTDYAGGITLTSLETIHSDQLNVLEGQSVTLNGENALTYIRSRETDKGANDRRMERQKQFLKVFASKAGNEILSNVTKVMGYYNTAKPYLVSNLDLSEITYLSTCCLTGNVGRNLQYLTISGQTSDQGEHMEFYPDENSLYETVLNAFYTTE